jgi:hypothetical protein
MKTKLIALLTQVLLTALAASGCIGPKGDTAQEKVEYVHKMREEALQQLYERDPELKQDVESAAGYGVFSIFGVHPGLFSFATGYGVFTNTATKKETHSKWFRLTLGPGIAVKGLYALVVVEDPELLATLEKGRWVFGSQAEASFRFGDFGGGLEWAHLFKSGVDVHYVTHTGVALELELIGGGKVYRNSDLNKAAAP